MKDITQYNVEIRTAFDIHAAVGYPLRKLLPEAMKTDDFRKGLQWDDTATPKDLSYLRYSDDVMASIIHERRLREQHNANSHTRFIHFYEIVQNRIKNNLPNTNITEEEFVEGFLRKWPLSALPTREVCGYTAGLTYGALKWSKSLNTLLTSGQLDDIPKDVVECFQIAQLNMITDILYQDVVTDDFRAKLDIPKTF